MESPLSASAERVNRCKTLLQSEPLAKSRSARIQSGDFVSALHISLVSGLHAPVS